MLKLSGMIFIIVAIIFGAMLLKGQWPPEQTLMEVQEIPEKGIDIRVCEVDADCIPIKEYCCDCSEGGKKVAVNRKYYKYALDEKVDQCLLQSCKQARSNDLSCNGGKATCVNGQCQMK